MNTNLQKMCLINNHSLSISLSVCLSSPRRLRQQLALGGQGNVGNATGQHSGQNLRVHPRTAESARMVHIDRCQSRHAVDVRTGALGLAQRSETFLIEETNVTRATARGGQLFAPAQLFDLFAKINVR